MSTSNYQVYGDMATKNGFRPGSGEWWAELRRLRAINNAPLTADGGITICNDTLEEIRAGMFVTAQLGNKTDLDWSPCAPCLLLHADVVFFGEPQFTGLYKLANGEYYIMQGVTKNRHGQELDGDDNTKIGVMYCTCWLPWDMDKMECKYMNPRLNHTLKEAMRFHSEKIAKLPVTHRFEGDK